ncbi:CRISPR-associated endonuclease Cas1 [Desulfonatronovibrio magnus]|uniref:CRISPR-associated endonuclease Cas1 n=1 Tax=Desulfonatronovibrio magnus TaxID=698827 RepID=UPI0005EB6CE4|nr:CRISPR-associated endonuclease Cas1 [Desulfonatronovibrio magnus]
MRRVYVLEPGSYLRKSGPNLALFKDRKLVDEIPGANLEQLVLMGYTSLTGGVMDFLIRNRVETVFLSPRGAFRGRLNIDDHKDVERRRKQYLNLSDTDFLLKTARFFVKGKLRNQARFLQALGQRNRNEHVLSMALALRTMIKSLPEIDSLDILRGIEGNAARIYFKAFGFLLKNPDFSFSIRTKRPPLDPVNALLSFIYTMLTNEVLSAIKTSGLDPYLGALHEPAYGRPSLACDLVEEWRTYLGDRLVLQLINKGSVKKDDFVYRDLFDTDFVDEHDLVKKRPVEMKPGIRKALVETYEKWMNINTRVKDLGHNLTHRGYILHQARKFQAYIQNETEEYQPFNLGEKM